MANQSFTPHIHDGHLLMGNSSLNLQINKCGLQCLLIIMSLIDAKETQKKQVVGINYTN